MEAIIGVALFFIGMAFGAWVQRVRDEAFFQSLERFLNTLIKTVELIQTVSEDRRLVLLAKFKEKLEQYPKRAA